MNDRSEQGGPPQARGREGTGVPQETTPGPRAGAARAEKKRRKVSLIAALVVNVITVIIVAIVIVAILLPGYRRSFTAAKAVKGADEVWVVVKTSEAMMRENNTDFLTAQDGLKNSLQEMVQSGGNNVYVYVRDGYPDRKWVRENLPETVQKWLEGLFPAAATTGSGGIDQKNTAETDSQEVKP